MTMAFDPGFNRAEALDLVALSAIVEGGAAPPQPTGWNMIFNSPVIGQFTEKWQLWQNASGSYAIVLRGTVLDAQLLATKLRTYSVRLETGTTKRGLRSVPNAINRLLYRENR
jgi:hypothetical protein